MAVGSAPQQHVPVAARAGGLTQQHLAGLVGAEDEDDLEVVPGAPAQVDHDRAVPSAPRSRGRPFPARSEVGAGATRRARRPADREAGRSGRRSLSGYRQIQCGPGRPTTPEEPPVDGAPQVVDAARAAGPRPGPDLARRHQRVVVAPAPDRLVVVDQQLGDLWSSGARGSPVVAVEAGERRVARAPVRPAAARRRCRTPAGDPRRLAARSSGTGATEAGGGRQRVAELEEPSGPMVSSTSSCPSSRRSMATTRLRPVSAPPRAAGAQLGVASPARAGSA